MTDKEIKDYCKNCDVEPPAMKFKCPECEHNPNNENNFAKDINVPHKEQIMIDGVDVSVCILRRRKEPNCTVCNGYSSKVFEFDCSDFKNCYFKQLSRKTAECEKYEQLFDELDKRVSISTKIFDCIVVSKIVKDIISKVKDGKNG